MTDAEAMLADAEMIKGDVDDFGTIGCPEDVADAVERLRRAAADLVFVLKLHADQNCREGFSHAPCS